MVERVGSGVVRFGLPGLLLGVSIAWISGARAPEALAQNRSNGAPAGSSGAPARPLEGGRSQAARPISGGDSNGTLALITSNGGPAQWLYLIDTKNRAFAVYRVDPTSTKGTVKLEASRQYQWDLKLEHYNNQAPEPDAIKATVKTLADSTQ
jgi:hypothetical protein